MFALKGQWGHSQHFFIEGIKFLGEGWLPWLDKEGNFGLRTSQNHQIWHSFIHFTHSKLSIFKPIFHPHNT